MDLDQEMDKLAQLIALRAQRKLGEKPKLALVGSAEQPVDRPAHSPGNRNALRCERMDVVLRDGHCKMIRHIRHRWGYPMQVLIDQACFEHGGIDNLPDDDLIQLHKDMERAEECLRDGVSFEDAGLLRRRFG